ncbi:MULTISPECIES: MFS transporter [Aliiglaciecola]|uniref:MFS transporter n=1 Tax=Aliiglaciecola TaxID=1406885 RepID=UPI001C088702|nr:MULTISPECIES: MFS transporter [Aliiglaciecola]MBU2879988.1 MFS transporter [Aliiglaciecola lipolytica]MDO6711012.1 MFS transporter [Aliiglaciecola sp. 2_MG-2023]MDO6754222.1 MFS transporter [Aliiglaciecola sp. 1_MG-2023]
MTKLNRLGRYTLLCIACLTIMVGAVIAPGLVSISNALGVADNAILLVTLPALGAVICAPIAGKLIDKYGAYPALIIGLFLYGLVGASVYWLHAPAWIFANRFLLGGMTSVVMAGCTVLISHWYFAEERLNMIAKQGMAIELGGVVFLFVGGLLAAQHWALPLSLYLIAWVFLVMLLLFVPRRYPAGIQAEPEEDSPKLLSGFSLNSVYLSAMLSMVLFFTAFVLMPSNMQEQGYNETQVGFLLAFISLMAVLAASFLPKLCRLFSEQGVLSVAFINFAVSYIFFLQTGTVCLVIGAVIIGFGFGFSIPLLNHMIVARSAVKVRGRNLSYFTMAVFLGQFLTSFVEYIPGGIDNIFLSCMALSVFIASILWIKTMRFTNKVKSST